METWTSLVVLSLAVVSTLSFPRPDAVYKIPKVGDGSRAQYYVLHSDGSYKYGFDTGDGHYEQAEAQAPGKVTGSFGYKDPTGADIKLEYTADDSGFIAKGDHLPVAPKDPFRSRVNEDTKAAATRGADTSDSAAASLSASSSDSDAPSASKEVAQVKSSLSDGSIGPAVPKVTTSDIADSSAGESDSSSAKLTSATSSGAVPSTKSAPSDASPSSETGSSSDTHPTATKSTGATSATKYSSPQGTSLSQVHFSHDVGDMLVQQFHPVNRDSYGYVFTALRR